MQIIVNESQCTGCGACARVCPVEAITVDTIAHISHQDCLFCAACVAECRAQALSIDETPQAVVSPPAPTSDSGTTTGYRKGTEKHGEQHRGRTRSRFMSWWK
ncbi:MAG: 4Fe-4S binding protein [Candidatus Lernaella stagnicola]|nr:4Fe-4S binding protein [Candidatus Lernaella stagnicola]